MCICVCLLGWRVRLAFCCQPVKLPHSPSAGMVWCVLAAQVSVAQIGFYDNVVQPSFQGCLPLVPMAQEALTQLGHNRRHWQDEVDAQQSSSSSSSKNAAL